jgi:hypothetical protein
MMQCASEAWHYSVTFFLRSRRPRVRTGVPVIATSQKVTGCLRGYVGITGGVPQAADDLL